MPIYEYECDECKERFEVRHAMNVPAPPCPNGHTQVHRIITGAPGVLHGMAAPVSKNATKEELRAKWAEETPKLRQKLTQKLGEETVNKYGSTLNTKYD
ncbi:MAG TPA: zinc ribbon domain-containing protein [Aggregatilineales bacterium]|nr:zinc ribbon domain-containing protein [Aggregatilineales bacterium]